MVDTIRAATLADVDAIANLHTATWRSAYRDIPSEAALGPGRDLERRAYCAPSSLLMEHDVVLFADDLRIVAVRRILTTVVFDANVRAFAFYHPIGEDHRTWFRRDGWREGGTQPNPASIRRQTLREPST